MKNFFKSFYDGFIGKDIETIKHVIKCKKEGRPVLDPHKTEQFRKHILNAPKALFKESWVWVLACIFIFCMGYLVGLEKCEVECNNFIVDNYADEILINAFPDNTSMKMKLFGDSVIVPPKMPEPNS